MWADLRVQVVTRLRWMNIHHAKWAWDKRVRDPLAPYGFAFFCYDSGRGRYELRTATRLFLRGDALHPLPRLVYEMTQQVVQCQRDGVDPLIRLTDRREPVSPEGRFLGVGVSSLDSRWQSWTVTQRHAGGVLDVPGRCLAVLNEGTSMVIDRGAREQYDQFRVRSTGELDVTPGQRAVDWRRAAGIDELLDGHPPLGGEDRQAVGDALTLLVDLARVIAAARP
ncbi:hypothetical protein [Dactylosporangium darangshiense]|uniref:hypothetical protein n=1 Tax=Dactylosporangium darangshiense TaxID=579108 RepID=UPI0036289798